MGKVYVITSTDTSKAPELDVHYIIVAVVRAESAAKAQYWGIKLYNEHYNRTTNLIEDSKIIKAKREPALDDMEDHYINGLTGIMEEEHEFLLQRGFEEWFGDEFYESCDYSTDCLYLENRGLPEKEELPVKVYRIEYGEHPDGWTVGFKKSTSASAAKYWGIKLNSGTIGEPVDLVEDSKVYRVYREPSLDNMPYPIIDVTGGDYEQMEYLRQLGEFNYLFEDNT